MADPFTKKQRSHIMRQVKSSRNKSTELKLLKFFRDSEIKYWRRNYDLFGKPDFVFPKLKIAVFVDGCFWHGHNCRNTTPTANKSYWDGKILRNKQRDQNVIMHLAQIGWKVIRLWECELNNKHG